MSTVISTSINELPVVNEVINGDRFIIDNGDQTRIVDFKDLILGLDNVSFAQTITDTSTAVTSVSSQIFNAAVTANTLTAGTHYIKLAINGINYAMLLSACA